MSDRHSRAAIILAGGTGTRLWPLSTEEKPKQFLRIFEGRSLLQHTWRRISRIVQPEAIFVATQPRYRGFVVDQIEGISEEQILLEPMKRNTAPAIATSCERIRQRLDDPVVAIFPSDHFVADHDSFVRSIEDAIRIASTHDLLLTIGIPPTEPSTGFGYIELGDRVDDTARRVIRFVEKPDRERAEEFLRSGDYRWNGGMFIWRTSAFERELRSVAPEIADLANEFAGAVGEDQHRAYARMPDISIDHAVMEKSHRIAAVEGGFDWSDVGSWRAVARLSPMTAEPSVILERASGAYVRNEPGRAVIVAGVENVAVIDGADGLLVLDLNRPELLRDAVARLNAKK